MDRALSQSLSPAEGELAEADLEQLEVEYARLEAAEQLPSVPSVGINVWLQTLCSAHVKSCTSVTNMCGATALTTFGLSVPQHDVKVPQIAASSAEIHHAPQQAAQREEPLAA